MPARKPLFIDSLGFPEEMATTDSSTFGGLTLLADIDMQGNTIFSLAAANSHGEAVSYGQSGVLLSGLNVAGNKITNLALATDPFDAVPLSQIQSLVQLLDVQPSCRLASLADLSATYNPTGGAGGTGQFTSAPTTVDSISVVTGDRILVKNQTDAGENGIYVVTATTTIWDRALDFDSNTEVTANAFTFIEEGTTQQDTGWVLTTNNPITLNTSDLNWAQFSSAGVITPGDGLVQTGNAFHVNRGFGIHIVSDRVEVDLANTDPGLTFDAASGLLVLAGDGIELTGDGVTVDLATNPGLEFTGITPNGELRVQVAPSGSIVRLTDGIAVNIDPTPNTLKSDSFGLGVVGLPINFQIDDVVTSGTVTAFNLNELTGGGLTTLHSHAGSGEATRVENTLTTDVVGVTLGDPVYITGNGIVSSSDNADNDSRFTFGIARTTAGASSSIEIVSEGLLPGVLTGATAGTPYYLSSPNGLTTVRPVGSSRTVYLVGFALNTTDLYLRLQYLGKTPI